MKTLCFRNSGTVKLTIVVVALAASPSCGGEELAGTGLGADGSGGSAAAGSTMPSISVGVGPDRVDSQEGGAELDQGTAGAKTENVSNGFGGGGGRAAGGNGGGVVSAGVGSGGAMAAGGGGMSAAGGSGGSSMLAVGGTGGLTQGGQGGMPANNAPEGLGGGGVVSVGGGGAAAGGQAGSPGEVSMGGAGMGGASMGGAPAAGGMGGSASCDQSPPPGDVSAWVDESWDAQLGNNIRSRKAWLLDSAILGEGQINLCVRWGASSPPSAAAKAQIAPSVENWFNDWFRALGDYDCFPYGQGIQSKITGWAVKPGNESWVSDLGPDIKIYTETDGEGEPKCADACSFFENWSHEFPNCPGGEAFHTDFWIWVDDKLPGGGAAAVGGDWGLRMPVAAFLNSLGKDGDNVIEHEMGHGFGFQDYYEWNGSRPAGGSLMIVGSQRGGSPTVGDTWLLRRTWSEMRVLRGW